MLPTVAAIEAQGAPHERPKLHSVVPWVPGRQELYGLLVMVTEFCGPEANCRAQFQNGENQAYTAFPNGCFNCIADGLHADSIEARLQPL
jgi:hypothetical protein